MNKTFTILFYLRTSKTNKSTGTVPIYMRITVDGLRSELTTNRSILPSKWNAASNRARGTNEESRSLNSALDNLKNNAMDIHRQLLGSNLPITAAIIRNRMQGLEDRGKSVMELLKAHNEDMFELIGKEYSIATYKKYETSLKHMSDFIKHTFNVTDMPVKQVNHKFITDYDFYLRTVKNHANNSVVKYIKNFKKVINIALANGWMDKDPFLNYKVKLRDTNQPFLTQEELDRVIAKQFDIERIERVRDVFVFCCYTGLSFIDVFSLSREHIVKGIDGDDWIVLNRKKTNIQSRIPILQPALEILEKYRDDAETVSKGKLLPVISNQKSNMYLKEIADVCGITKTLSTHCARRTMGTTIAMSNGLPLPTISRILGHSSSKITEKIYAKLTDTKLSEDVNALKQKLAAGKN